jgi:SAM-dependent methyltransferase
VKIKSLGRVGDAGATEHYADPLYYSKTYKSRTHDVEYYAKLARRSKGPVLEYGIGNGRVALAIAKAGVHVTGVDLSQPMLDSLAAQLETLPKQLRARVDFRHGDMRELSLGRRFPLVIAPFNCVLHLYERPDMEAFLARVREHLAPGGRFVFDFSVPHGEDLCRDPDKAFSAPRIRHPTTGELTRYAERFEYDRLRQLLLIKMEFSPEGTKTKPWTVPLTHRQYFPREMEALLHYNGFTEIFFTADFTDEPADQHVDSLIVNCRAAD